MQYPVTAHGIPALARVTHYVPYCPGDFNNPPEGPEVEYEILDRRGREAPWLERKLTAKDRDEIWSEVMYQIKQDHSICYDPQGRWWEEP